MFFSFKAGRLLWRLSVVVFLLQLSGCVDAPPVVKVRVASGPPYASHLEPVQQRLQPTRTGVYLVEPGDTLWAIAVAHDIDLENLAQWNHIQNPDQLFVGQKLQVHGSVGDSPPSEVPFVSVPSVSDLPPTPDVPRGIPASPSTPIARDFSAQEVSRSVVEEEAIEDPAGGVLARRNRDGHHIVGGAQERMRAERAAAERMAFERAAAESMASEQAVAGRMRSERRLARRMSSERASSGSMASQRAAVGSTTSQRASSGSMASQRVAIGRMTGEIAVQAAGVPASLPLVVPMPRPIKSVVRARPTPVVPPHASHAKTSKPTPPVRKPQGLTVSRNAWVLKSGKPKQWVWPLEGRILDAFRGTGQRRNTGIDIAAQMGAEVRATAEGVVAYADNALASYGNLILLRHGGSFMSAYAHNDKILVKRGDLVRAGEVIAHAGKSGRAASPRLHFELRKNVTPLNPMRYLPKRAKKGP